MIYKEVVEALNTEATKAAPPVTVGVLHLFGITLSDGVMILTGVYLVMQMFFLLRDKWWRERKRDPKK